jgi:hypothetical protein
MNRDEVLFLNAFATNRTKARKEEGVDWDFWSFYPGTDGHVGQFSDGHDYAGHPNVPYDGWELPIDEVRISASVILELASGIQAMMNEVYRISDGRIKAERVSRASISHSIGCDLHNKLITELLRPKS